MSNNAKDTIAAKLARYAELENIIAAVTAEQQQKVQAIVAATKEGLAAEVREFEALEAQLEKLATKHRTELYGDKGKTLDMGTHTLSFRASDVVECNDEAEVIEALQTTAEDPAADETQRLAAAACLRWEAPKLDKLFIRKHWRTHAAWFSGYFGFRKTRKEKFTIKAKATPELEIA